MKVACFWFPEEKKMWIQAFYRLIFALKKIILIFL